MEYFEALDVGQTASFGAYDVTAAEITSFAGQYDPQPFHTDETAAAESMFGGLVASGWHTAAMTMRLLVDNYLADSGAMGALGVDDLRWPAPVRPGDTLSVTTEIVEKADFDDSRGRVATRVTTTTDEDVTVLSMVGQILWRRRE
ncbi:MaoC/PaaZ C-terminal domain-containing protein [Halomicroarcula sp. GCM10025709]|uniref:MaoC/PaaZ C-terminal domain-containing protein n=1 Tax=Haloarcula TaxID=2237 RepID=UPI0024C36676|nr:MaoC/PaaZ C-terminal domain-containing protein [Halomicroarcula sp. YJ-61-S]